MGSWLVGLPKVMLQWLSLLFRIHEVSSLNLGPKTGYPEVSRGFPQSSRLNPWTVP
jgi:hypothetical protein